MQYAVTTRKTNKPITETHYHDYLAKIGDLGKVGNVNFETKRGLHCHFLLNTTSNYLDYKKLRPTKKGWNVKVVPIYNKRGWVSYCRKEYNTEAAEKELAQQFKMPTKRLF